MVGLKMFKKIRKRKENPNQNEEDGRRFVFRRDGKGTNRNNNSKSVNKSNNIFTNS